MSARMPGAELAVVVAGIREELTRALHQASDQRLRFELGDIELELTVAVTQDSKVDGGIKVYVLNFGAAEHTSTVTTHRLKINLKPRDRTSGLPPKIAAREQYQPG
ncbi:trypco2 family protein [Actinomadura scrupuli]|uniref:trypco2 family protein n=1 Tax=Actinomadura scrupuli TaxID=559629 RepID=UPI003D99AFB8